LGGTFLSDPIVPSQVEVTEGKTLKGILFPHELREKGKGTVVEAINKGGEFKIRDQRGSSGKMFRKKVVSSGAGARVRSCGPGHGNFEGLCSYAQGRASKTEGIQQHELLRAPYDWHPKERLHEKRGNLPEHREGKKAKTSGKEGDFRGRVITKRVLTSRRRGGKGAKRGDPRGGEGI